MTTLASPGIIRSEQYDLAAFGAQTGAAGCTDEFADWVDYLLDANVVGTVPHGDFYLEDLTERVMPLEGTFGIRGQGASTRFIFPSGNDAGGLKVESYNRQSTFELSNLKAVADGCVGGIPFEFKIPEGGARHGQSLLVSNVEVTVADEAVESYFDTGLRFPGAWHPTYLNMRINGPGIYSVPSLTGLQFKMGIGLDIESNYRPNFINTSIWSAYDGIVSDVYRAPIASIANNGSGNARLTLSVPSLPFTTGFTVTIFGSAGYDGTYTCTRINDTQVDIDTAFTGTDTGTLVIANQPEDFRASNFHIVNVRRALRIIRPTGREPVLQLSDGHINYLETGIEVDGFKQININGMAIYNVDATNVLGGTPVDILLKDADSGMIRDNVLTYPGNPNRVGVKIENNGTSGSGDLFRITDNMVKATMTNFVQIAAGCTNIEVMDNDTASATISGAIVVDSDGGNICQTDSWGKEIAGTWTPALSFGGGSTGITYSARSANYSIRGKLLYIHVDMTLTSKGTSTGTAAISLPSLPGPFDPSSNSGAIDVTLYANMAGVTSPVSRPVSAGSMWLSNQGATGITEMTEANFTNTTRVVLDGVIKLS